MRDVVHAAVYTIGYLIVTSTAVWLMFRLTPDVLR